MKQEKIQSIRNALVGKMEALWSMANDTISKMKNTEGKYADFCDRATVEADKFVELAFRDRERHLIFAIEETIIRIDRGVFGVCDHCGKNICEKRLLIEPLSRLCTACQEKYEMRNKHGRKSNINDLSCNHA